jgi:hypothetical protein
MPDGNLLFNGGMAKRLRKVQVDLAAASRQVDVARAMLTYRLRLTRPDYDVATRRLLAALPGKDSVQLRELANALSPHPAARIALRRLDRAMNSLVNRGRRSS